MTTLAPPRSLRSYLATDAGTLAEFLTVEGVKNQEMVFSERSTFVLEEGTTIMGFATVTVAHQTFPEVIHFVIGRAYRNAARARFLIRAVRMLVREAGSPKLIIHGRQPYQRRLIEWYFRAEPYALIGERAYYVVPA